jgi:hypothetical protein
MFDLITSLIRRNRRLYAHLRALKYTMWSTPVVGKAVADPPELIQMETVGRQTAPGDFAAPGGGPRILFFTLRGWSTHVAWEATLAAALRLRGADVRFWTCGKRLPLCDIASCHASPPTPCDFCATYVNRALAAWRFPVRRLRDFITPAEVADLYRQVITTPYKEYSEFVAEGLPVGKLVTTSVCWFLCSGTIGDDDLSRQSYRDFLTSGAVMARVGARLLDAMKPEKLFLLNGLFFAERIMMELARARGLPVVTYEGGFMPDTLVFAHNHIAPYYELDDVWPCYVKTPLAPAEAAQLDDYLFARKSGGRDAAKYFPSIEKDKQAIVARLGLRRDKKLVTLFTNILWDSAILDRDRAFNGMIEWLDESIRHFIPRDDVQLVIRVHPAEVRLAMQESHEQVAEMLAARYPHLPSHIKIVPPESDLSSYVLMQMSDVGLVYTSTTGLEMALDGKPVIVAGQTHYAGKGFTYDVASRDEYLALLNRLVDLSPLSAEAIERARRYAYLFFFCFMLPFPAVTTLPRGRLRFNFETLGDLHPGRWPELDLICHALLNDAPFIRETGVT